MKDTGASLHKHRELIWLKIEPRFDSLRDDSRFVVYPNAEHGFHADYRPSYNKTDAEDGWRRLQEWFKKHGAA